MFNIYLIYIAIVSLITLIMFLIDKIFSKKENHTRIPESALLSFVSFGGALGGVIGILLLRHKSSFERKFHFVIGIWLSFFIQLALGVFIRLWENGQISF